MHNFGADALVVLGEEVCQTLFGQQHLTLLSFFEAFTGDDKLAYHAGDDCVYDDGAEFLYQVQSEGGPTFLVGMQETRFGV